MRRLGIVVGLASVLCLAQPADAGEWEKLGERTVNFGLDRDVIHVSAEHVYSKIKLNCKGQRGVHFRDVKVYFRNGNFQDIKIRKRIEAGGETRVIDLKGGGRSIQKIVFWYDSTGRRPGRRGKRQRKKAHVAVWAKRGGAVKAPVKKVVWKKLGERKVKKRTERDVIHVTGAEGTFRKIKLHVRDAPIHFMDLKVHFANGEVHDVKIRKLFKPGSDTRVIDLPGKVRIIKKVTMWYKTIRVGMGKATVALWGGRIAGADPGKVRPPSGDAVFLGEKVAKHRGERDVIHVTAAEGRYRKVQLRIRDRGIKLHRINIVFGNGENMDKNFPGGKLLKKNTVTPWLDLHGKRRVIKKVVFWYRSVGFTGPRAKVRLWGKR